MAPKKAKVVKEGEVDYLDEFTKKYRKTMKENPELGKIKDVEEMLAAIAEFGDDIPYWFFKEEYDSPDRVLAFRILMQCLAVSGYNKFKAFRLWQTGGGDELVRNVMVYIDSPCQKLVGEGLVELQMTACGITPLGCQFIARSFGYQGNINIQCLRLDFNRFGSEGLKELAVGLAVNPTINRLDLNYCDIDETGGEYLFQILIFVKSQLKTLELRGNRLGNEGLLEIIRGAKCAKQLVAIDLSDNKITDDKTVLEGLVSLFQTSKTLTKYVLLGNYIFDDGMAKLIHGLIGLTHITDVTIPEECSKDTFEALDHALGKAAVGKGKKKK